MIIQCPACAGRFSARQQRFAGKRISIRCSRCQHLFQVAVPPIPRRKILLAHQDSRICESVSQLLKANGFALHVSQDGAQTLQDLEAWQPDVLLLGVAMPGFLPFEIPQKIRGNPLLMRTKVILLASIFNQAAYRRRPDNLYGADDYVDEHLFSQELVNKIDRVMQQPEVLTNDDTSAG